MVMFWVCLLAISVLMYLLLDGFDLGVGILFGFTRDEQARASILGAVAPVWDGNETWLVVSGVILWGAFPIVYSMLLPAFYIPVIVMLLGLILRGVAFEFRSKAEATRWIWSASFVVGSFCATFMQGVMVGALVHGMKFEGQDYAGGPFGWCSVFSILCGISLCLGYALLGACWIVRKCKGGVREHAHELIPYLASAVLVSLCGVFMYALGEHAPILLRWFDRPYLFIFPAVGAVAAGLLATSILVRNDFLPFPLVSVMFVTAFGALALSFWPDMIPYVVTIEEAAAPRSSLAFMFWGEGLFIFPLLLLYTSIGYRVFRGKIDETHGHY